MATPLVAGVAGLIRSANPLLPSGAGATAGELPGVRQLLERTAVRPDGGEGWDARLGHGVPRADLALVAALGTVGKKPIALRLTPLFRLYSSGALDRGVTATPQRAASLILGPPSAWQPEGAPVPGYPLLPGAGGAIPLADVFVFSHAPGAPSDAFPALHSLRRARPWPLGCTPGEAGCAGDHVDHLSTTSVAEIEALRAQGYDYLGVDGFVHAPCAPEPSCMPLGTVRLLRMCHPALDDCATVPESSQASLAGLGYQSPAVLGYAFPNVDTDGDASIDGWEALLKLDPSRPDSDFDGVADGVEYPLAGVPAPDPCPRGDCGAAFVFGHGFEH